MSSPRHVVVGTAGHVDHGKSALVKALTGTDPDRLAEEKAREMTIDLGFAFLHLPGSDEPVAIVDVPGHEMFVRNMVAGATGIDAAIFVVAADEGVMPQTVEHLDVLSSLRVSAGVVALTKADKASPERILQVSAQVRELLAGTLLENARILPVSSLTRDGLPDLIAELAAIAGQVQTRSPEGIFRLPVDRVFTIKGAGTVVTGTVVSGSLATGEKVDCLPGGRTLRVRMLHVHNQVVDRIYAGQRAAINLPEAKKEELERGDVLATLGALTPTLMLDARVSLGERAARGVGQRTRLRVHHGTKEVMARVVLLESDELPPGETMLAQFRLEGPLVVMAGDPFVLRWYSPPQVIGGGVVVDAHPPKRRRAAGAAEVAEREAQPAAETIAEMLNQAGARGLAFDQMRERCGLAAADLRSLLGELETEGRAKAGRRDLWLAAEALERMSERLVRALATLHRQHHLKSFLSLAQVVSAVAPPPEEQEALRLAVESLAQRGTVISEGNRLRLATHRPEWSDRFAQARDYLLAELLRSRLATPSPEELASASGLNDTECEQLLDALVESGDLQAIASDIYVHRQVIDGSRARVIEYLRQHGRMSIPEAREILGASRRYLLPFLEGLDREGLTARQGDYRVLRKRADG
jgi:selenocysteine-specific elongation factor